MTVLTSHETTAVPNDAEGTSHGLATVCAHGGLSDLEGLTKSGDLEEVKTGAEKEVGELDGLLLELRGHRGRSGRDSSGGGHAVEGRLDEGGLTKAFVCFVAKEGEERRWEK